MSTATTVTRKLNAVVVSAGLMQKTVKVRVGHQQWNKHIRKNYKLPTTYLAHDPNSSLRAGDIVEVTPGFRVSKNVRHVVTKIVAPFGPSIEERPPVPSLEEWVAIVKERKQNKDERRAKLREAAEEEALEEALEDVEGLHKVLEGLENLKA